MARYLSLSFSSREKFFSPLTHFASVSAPSSSRRRSASTRIRVTLPVASRLAPSSSDFRRHLPSLGLSGHRSLRDDGVNASSSLFAGGDTQAKEAFDALARRWSFSARLRVSSSSSPSSRPPDAGGVDDRLPSLLPAPADAEVVPALLRLQVEEVFRLPTLPEVVGLTSVLPPLPRLPLLAGKLIGGYILLVPDSTLANIGCGWRGSTTRRLDAAWECFFVFLLSRQLPLPSADVSVVAVYPSFLFEPGRAFRTIMLLRPSFSSILLLFEGVLVGNHPVLSHLCRVVFEKRPPPLSAPPSIVERGVGIRHLRRFAAAIGLFRCAFFLASTSPRRPSEWASFRCDPADMVQLAGQRSLLPSQLSKTDRRTHMGPPILIRRLPPSSPLCLVAALEDLLHSRTFLGIRHIYVFSSLSSPHHPISVRLSPTSFDGSSSTRHFSASEAVARGLSIDDALRAGDWSGASIFFRHSLVRPAFRGRSEIFPARGRREIIGSRGSRSLVSLRFLAP